MDILTQMNLPKTMEQSNDCSNSYLSRFHFGADFLH